MPRRARFVMPGMPHHVTQRGNNRQNVFEQEVDYWRYCHWLNKYAFREGVEITAFCLMTNHVHFIAIPPREHSLSRLFNAAHMRYAQYMNKKRRTSGHLWQGRFYSCVLDDVHLDRAVRYVEQNPVRSRMIRSSCEYEWSSARWHAGKENAPKIILKGQFIANREEWARYLDEKDESFDEEMRFKTMRGLAVGTEGFIAELERKTGLLFRISMGGRPRNAE